MADAKQFDKQETPRTDGVALITSDGTWVPVEFASQLERELADVTDRLAGYERHVAVLEGMQEIREEEDLSAILPISEGACPTCRHPIGVEPGSVEWHRLHTERELWILAVIEELDAARRGVAITYATGNDPLRMLKLTTATADQLRKGLEIHERVESQYVEKKK